MKRQLILLLLCNLIGCFTPQLIAQNSPLPPINTHPVWEIQIVGQTEVIYDTLTYGQRYCRCGQDYVAIVRNGEEDIMYMRQTSDKAFYLLDIDDCATERLLYDYSTDTVQIPVQNVLFITDSFDLFTYTLNQEEPAGMFQISGTLARFTYQLGPFTLNSQAIWLRGVGDIDHPLFPLFNNYNDSATESRYHLARLTVDHQVWYDASSLEPASVEIIYVDQDAGAGQQNGSSWADAYTNLNVALQSANAGDWVWVAEGIYTPGNGTARDTAFELRNDIQLFGGFNGTETYLPDRGDPALHATILSGDIGVLGDSTDNSYHVLRIQDVADFALLDGFTIRDGNALGGNVSFPFTENGAGILIYAGLPTTNTGSIVLKNLILTQHTALNGSAISIADGFPIPLRLSISQCTIHHNYAMQRGAGLFTPWSLAQALDVSITDSEFRANRFRSGGGGAIYDYHAKTNWNVVNTVFAENGPVVGGGGGGGAWGLFQAQGTKHIQILGCAFSDNSCTGEGGGIEYYHSGGPGHLSLSIEKTVFQDNESFFNNGGAVFVTGGFQFTVDFSAVDCDFINNISRSRGGAFSTRIEGDQGDAYFNFDRCAFRNNKARSSSLGGAIEAIIETPNDQTTISRTLYLNIRNSLFAGNKGAIVQGIRSVTSGVIDSISNCTFIDNGPIVFGKGYSTNFNDVFRSDIYLKNSIIWEPELPFWQILYNGDPEDLSVYDYELDHCVISVDTCDLPGGEEACLTFPNLFNINPQFVDSDNDDYRLKHCSPLLNQGVNLSAFGRFDLEGNLRILDDIVDIGAYETSGFEISTAAATTSLACASDSTGSLSFNTLNGTLPINYTLIGQDMTINNTDGQFDSLPPGAYQVRVADGQSCGDTLDIIISAPLPFVISATAEPYVSNLLGGIVQLDSIRGGTPPYHLFFEEEAWDGAPLTNLSPGSYLINSIDAQGCQVDTLIEVGLVNGITNRTEEPLKLWVSPNPLAVGSPINLTLSHATNQQYQLEIWTAAGKKIATAVLLNNVLRPASFTPTHAGLYLVVLRDKAGQRVASSRVLVQ